jgi:hypothetical protein
MAVYRGPQIVTNGLTMCCDTLDKNSYPGTGAVWYDLSGNALNATGNSSYISSTGITSGVSFTTPTTGILNTDTHSVFFMIKFNSSGTYPNGTTGGWEKIFSYNAGGSDRSPGVWRYPSNRLIHWRYDPSNTGVDFSSTLAGDYFVGGTEFVLNTWYYVGVTKNGATATAYVNGIRVGSNTVSNPKTAGTATIIINEGYTNPLNNINCLTVYNRVLTPNEVFQNYSIKKTRFGI